MTVNKVYRFGILLSKEQWRKMTAMSLQRFVCMASQIYLPYTDCVVRNGIVGHVSAIVRAQQPLSCGF